MTRAVAAVMLVLTAASLSTAASIGALAQEPNLAPEGRGLLPRSVVTGLPPEPAETRPGGLTSFGRLLAVALVVPSSGQT